MADTGAADSTAPIVVLHPDPATARQITFWLRSAGLGRIAAARTCDEALFLLGRQNPMLLIADDGMPASAERRLLGHIKSCGYAPPCIVRLVEPGHVTADAAELVHKPVDGHELVVRVGTVLARPDLLGRMDRERDQSAAHLAAARRMQLGLLPAKAHLAALQQNCGVGIAGLCRSGEAVGGDFWWAAPTGERGFALALADFAGHGLTAALNTFRLHAIMSEQVLPHDQPVEMTGLLNRRLHALLPRGQYATMIYMQIDPAVRRVDWCSAGGPTPLFVSAAGTLEFTGSGLPLGVRPDTPYQPRTLSLPAPGILCLFSDGLYESGGAAPDLPREAMAAVLTAPAAQAHAGRLQDAAGEAVALLDSLRKQQAWPDHSDDVMAVCVAIG